MKRAAAAAVVIMLLIPCGAAGQSIYGMNYIGEAVSRGNARSQALGYSSVAVPDTSNSVVSNPAATADLSMVTLTIQQALSGSRIYYLDELSRQTRYIVPAFAVSFPVRKGLVVSGGYRTRFMGRADFAYTIDIDGVPPGYQNYKLDCNLFALPVSVAWHPFEPLRVAGEIQFNLGSVIDKTNVWFDDPNYLNVDAKRRRSYTGLSWGASLLWDIHPRLSLGLVIDGPVEYDVEQVVENTVSVLDTTTSFGYKLPLAMDFGLALNPYGRWWLSASYWQRTVAEPVGFPVLRGNVGDESHIGFGIERRESPDGHLFNRMPIRLGFYTDTWHYEFPSGQEVRSYFFTIGSAIPLKDTPGAIDYTIEFGRIGSKAENFVEENIIRFGLSFSVQEPWTRRREEKH
jgi:hypothetical protein